MSSPDDLPRRAAVDVARAEARLSGRAAAAGRRVRARRCLAALPDALLALWFKLLGRRRAQPAIRRLAIAGAALGLAVSRPSRTWFLRVVSDRTQRRFRDRVTDRARVARRASCWRRSRRSSTTSARIISNRLAVLRNQVFVLDHMHCRCSRRAAGSCRLGVTVALLMSIHPALALLALFALPTVLTSTWRPGVERAAEERGRRRQPPGAAPVHRPRRPPPPARRCASPASADGWSTMRRAAWERWYRPGRRRAHAQRDVARARLGGLRRGVRRRGRCSSSRRRRRFARRRAAGPRRRIAAVRLHRRARSAKSDFSAASGSTAPSAWRGLEDYAASLARQHRCGGARPPGPRHPLRSRVVRLSRAPTRRGARRREPRAESRVGRGDRRRERRRQDHAREAAVPPVSADERPHPRRRRRAARACPSSSGGAAWPARSRTSSASSSRARHSVGVGDVPRLDDEPAVRTAVDRAGAADVVERLGSGLETQLGPTWPDGVEVSFGQWQKLALARGFMRDRPLRAGARRADGGARRRDRTRAVRTLRRGGQRRRRSRRPHGRHASRFSCRIASARCGWPISSSCLDGARVVEVGTHDELVAQGGQHAELYAIQAASYR